MFCISSKADAGNLIYPASIRDTAKSEIGWIGNRHLNDLDRTRSRGKLCTGGRTPGERHSLNRIILNSAVNSVRSWKAEGEEKGRG